MFTDIHFTMMLKEARTANFANMKSKQVSKVENGKFCIIEDHLG